MIAFLFLVSLAPGQANAQASYQIVAQYQKAYAIFVNGVITEKFQLYPKENNTVLWQIIWPYQQARTMEVGVPTRYQTPEATFDIYICEIHQSYVIVGWTVIQGQVEIADPELVQPQQPQLPNQAPNQPGIVAVAAPWLGGDNQTTPLASYATTEQISELKEQINELNSEVTALKQEIAQLRQQAQKGGVSQEDLNRLQAKVAALDTKVSELSSQMEALTQVIGEVKKDVESVKTTALISGDLQEDLTYLAQRDPTFASLLPMYQWLLSSNQVPDQIKTQLIQSIHRKAEETRRRVQLMKYLMLFGVPSVIALLVFLVYKIKWRPVEAPTVVPEPHPMR